MPLYQKGDVRIRYQEVGTGFPLLVTPGGGLNSRVSNWPTAVINAMEVFKNDFRCITMDQRNANGGESTGPVAVDDAAFQPLKATERADHIFAVIGYRQGLHVWPNSLDLLPDRPRVRVDYHH